MLTITLTDAERILILDALEAFLEMSPNSARSRCRHGRAVDGAAARQERYKRRSALLNRSRNRCRHPDLTAISFARLAFRR